MKLPKFSPWLHRLLIPTVLWQFATADWVTLGNRLGQSADGWDWAHVVIGLVITVLSLVFTLESCGKSQWRQYFPWIVGNLRPLGRDLAGIVKGRFPTGGGGGLFSILEGLGLVLMMWAGLTGVVWLWFLDSPEAWYWRSQHLYAAKGVLFFLILHAVASIGSVLDLIRGR